MSAIIPNIKNWTATSTNKIPSNNIGLFPIETLLKILMNARYKSIKLPISPLANPIPPNK